MPAKPRSPTHGRSPAANALRSMPAQNALARAGEDADGEVVVGVEIVERGGDALGQRAG